MSYIFRKYVHTGEIMSIFILVLYKRNKILTNLIYINIIYIAYNLKKKI